MEEDDLPTITVESLPGEEGGYITYTVRLSDPAEDAVTVAYRTLPGTALIGSDVYATGGNPLSGVLTFLPGEQVRPSRPMWRATGWTRSTSTCCWSCRTPRARVSAAGPRR